jgi:hypothetical protein
MAQESTQKGPFVAPGAILYYYSNQHIIASSQVPGSIQVITTTDSPVVEVISEDKSLGMVQVLIKINNDSIPVLLWTRIVNLK